jgi:protein disulfide-isomerase A1
MFALFYCFALASGFSWFGATTDSPPVVELGSEDDLKKAIGLHELTAVLFYAPWCPYSKQLLPVWEELGKKTLQEPRLGIAQMDADVHSSIAKAHGVLHFPEILLFTQFTPERHQASHVYQTSQVYRYPQGLPRSWAALSNWIHEHADRLHNLATASAAEDFVKGHQFTLIAANPVAEMKALVDASRNFETVAFATAEPPAVEWLRNRYPSAGKASIFMISPFAKSGAEGYTGNSKDAGELDKFARGRLIADVSVFNMYTADTIFGVGLPTLCIFLESDMPVPGLKAAVEKGREHVVVAKVIGREGLAERKLADMLACEAEEFPFVRIIQEVPSEYHTNQGSMGLVHHATKFRPSQEPESAEKTLSEDYLKRFVSEYITGDIKPYLKSEPEPISPSQPNQPLEVVGSTFEQMVLKSEVPVLVDFYAHWCGHCKLMAGAWNNLARKLQKQTRYVRVAKIDATKNEIPGINIRAYPTIYLYKKGSSPIEYQGERQIEEWMRFLIEQGVLTGNEEFAAEVQGSEL